MTLWQLQWQLLSRFLDDQHTNRSDHIFVGTRNCTVISFVILGAILILMVIFSSHITCESFSQQGNCNASVQAKVPNETPGRLRRCGLNFISVSFYSIWPPRTTEFIVWNWRKFGIGQRVLLRSFLPRPQTKARSPTWRFLRRTLPPYFLNT